MPKIVDWDARRDEILSATWQVIARDGIARATIRAIAREAGCSRGILAHYFDAPLETELRTKDALWLQRGQLAADRRVAPEDGGHP